MCECFKESEGLAEIRGKENFWIQVMYVYELWQIAHPHYYNYIDHLRSKIRVIDCSSLDCFSRIYYFSCDLIHAARSSLAACSLTAWAKTHASCERTRMELDQSSRRPNKLINLWHFKQYRFNKILLLHRFLCNFKARQTMSWRWYGFEIYSLRQQSKRCRFTSQHEKQTINVSCFQTGKTITFYKLLFSHKLNSRLKLGDTNMCVGLTSAVFFLEESKERHHLLREIRMWETSSVKLPCCRRFDILGLAERYIEQI